MYEIISADLAYKKVGARWVPRILTEEHKQKLMGAVPTFLNWYLRQKMVMSFLTILLPGFLIALQKFNANQWNGIITIFSIDPKKAKRILSTRKVMPRMVWDQKGVLLIE